MNYTGKISIDPNKRFGRPCVQGTRIAVSDILNWLSNGMSPKEIIQEFPELREEDIFLVLKYASQREERILLAG